MIKLIGKILFVLGGIVLFPVGVLLLLMMMILLLVSLSLDKVTIPLEYLFKKINKYYEREG